MFWLRNNKIKFLLRNLNESPVQDLVFDALRGKGLKSELSDDCLNSVAASVIC